VTPDQFQLQCKRLWHVAPNGAWDRIKQFGFQTAEQLIKRADLDETTRQTLLTTPRPRSVRLVVDGETVVLRDQGPLLGVADLSSKLAENLSVAEFIHLLNNRVYIFTREAEMKTLRNKYVALDGAQDVVMFSPWKLVTTLRSRLQLASQNAGAIAHKMGALKDHDLFVSLIRFPDKSPQEVTILDGFDDLGVVTRADRYYEDGTRESLPLT
jgi:hypothetical protein